MKLKKLLSASDLLFVYLILILIHLGLESVIHSILIPISKITNSFSPECIKQDCVKYRFVWDENLKRYAYSLYVIIYTIAVSLTYYFTIIRLRFFALLSASIVFAFFPVHIDWHISDFLMKGHTLDLNGPGYYVSVYGPVLKTGINAYIVIFILLLLYWNFLKSKNERTSGV